MSLLKVNDLKLGYPGKVVIDNLSFTLNESDYLCIVGENGSGKTTLVKALLGLQSRLQGSVEYGDNVTPNHIGYLSQQPRYSSDFPASVSEIVMSGFLSRRILGFGYSRREREKALGVMETVGVSELRRKNFSELSGGQQQRVLLARALCATKKLLLLDEPTSALDPIATAEFYSIIKKLCAQGVAVIMVSHDINAAVRNASHIICLESGKSFFGTTHEFIHSPMGQKLIISDCPCEDCNTSGEGTP